MLAKLFSITVIFLSSFFIIDFNSICVGNIAKDKDKNLFFLTLFK